MTAKSSIVLQTVWRITNVTSLTAPPWIPVRIPHCVFDRFARWKKILTHFSWFSGPELLQLLVLLKCHPAMIHILTIKQQVRHQGKMAKQSGTMLKPGNFLLPMGDREILLFANHRFIALGAPQVKEQSFSHQVSVKQMLAIRIKYLRWVRKEVVGFSTAWATSVAAAQVTYLVRVKSLSDLARISSVSFEYLRIGKDEIPVYSN